MSDGGDCKREEVPLDKAGEEGGNISHLADEWTLLERNKGIKRMEGKRVFESSSFFWCAPIASKHPKVGLLTDIDRQGSLNLEVQPRRSFAYLFLSQL